MHAACRLGVDLGYVITGVRHGIQEETFITIPLVDPPCVRVDDERREPLFHYRLNGMTVSRDWLTLRGLKSENLRVVKVSGHSMKGVLADGDKVIVDMDEYTPRSGFMYVLRQAGEYVVAYCQQMPGGMLRVSSASPSFPSYDVDLNNAADFNILGRVVASMHEW